MARLELVILLRQVLIFPNNLIDIQTYIHTVCIYMYINYTFMSVYIHI